MTALVAAVLLVITDWRKTSVPLTEGLERNPYGGGSRTERLIAETENKEKTEINVEVKEQLYTTEEIKALFDKCIRQLDRLILGENKSLDYVTSDMKLVTQIPEVPVEVEWELSRYDVMNIYGEIQEDVLKEEGIQITLKAVLTYMAVSYTHLIGLYRDPDTFEPIEYYCKLPADCDEREVFVVDPMLATGGSCVAAIQLLKDKGVKNIRFMCIIAAPEGVERMKTAHPDVDLYIGALDDHLNEHKYIVPGLGDAGDRIFGTK